MRIRAFRHVGDPNPIVTEVASLILEKNDGTPVAAASEVGTGLCAFTTCEDPDFHQHLRTLGLDRVVIVQDLTDALVPVDKRNRLPLITGPRG